MIFRVNFDRLIRQQLPVDLRKGLLLAFLTAFITPLKGIYNAFLSYRQNNLYVLEITPQVCYLEKVLNDRFDPEYRRISIHDPVRIEQAYIYLNSEGKPLYLNPKQDVYLGGELAAMQVSDFIVHVPASVTDLTRLRAVLDRYKLPTKVYELKIT